MLNLNGKKIGFAITGSFCTFKKVLDEIEKLSINGADIIPIMSEISYVTDTRFGDAKAFTNRIEMLCDNPIIKSIKEAEPIGPKKMLDLLIVAPCTGNTLAKLANGIADTSITLAVKAHLRNQRPLLIAVSTNDGLANAAKNIGFLLNYKYTYFVPFGQDDPINKPCSLVADMTKIVPAAEYALEGKQLQPILG